MSRYVLALQETGCHISVTARDMRTFFNINYICTDVVVVEGVVYHATNSPTSYFLTNVFQGLLRTFARNFSNIDFF